MNMVFVDSTMKAKNSESLISHSSKNINLFYLLKGKQTCENIENTFFAISSALHV